MNYFLKFLTTFIFFVLIQSKVLAGVVTKIEIQGNNRVSDETIKVYGDFDINDNIDEKKLNEILNNLYSTNFFKDVKIKESNGILSIIVKEYPFVNQLIITGEPSNKIRDEIKKQISTKAKRSFIKSSLSKDINLIKKLYSSIGYNFANIDVKLKELDYQTLMC